MPENKLIQAARNFLENEDPDASLAYLVADFTATQIKLDRAAMLKSIRERVEKMLCGNVSERRFQDHFLQILTNIEKEQNNG